MFIFEAGGVHTLLVKARPSIEKGDVVNPGEGPGPVVTKIVEQFSPKAIYGKPSRRQFSW